MSSINFDNIWLLLIAIPLIAAFAIPFAVAVRKENRNGHNVASIVMHVAMSVIIAFAAAGTSVKTVLTETEVFIVADVSYSANRNLGRVDEIIRGIKLPDNSKVGLVCFGKDSELLNTPTSKEKLKSVTEASVDDSETDIAGALNFAGEQFRSDVIKRIVLITDGRQTDESDAFAISRAVSELRMRNVKVDAVYLNDNLQETDKEVQISAVSFTKTAFLNHEERVDIEIRSNNDARVYVNCPGAKGQERKGTELTAGTNTVTFDLPTDVAGTYHYEVSVEMDNAEDDANPNNNRYLFTQVVSSEVKVLVVTENWDDVTAAVARYGSSAELDIYELSSASSTMKKEYKAGHESDTVKIHLNERVIPYTVEMLAQYDEIVLADMNVCSFDNYNAFVESVQKVVSGFGKSLVAAGDLHLQLADGETPADPGDSASADAANRQKALQSLADILPVRYGRSQNDAKLYAIVIDISRSMFQNNHLALAKTVAKRLVGILNPNDYVCIVAFAGEIWVRQPPSPNTNPDRLYSLIDGLEQWQGTMISSSLREAQRQLAGAGEFGGGKQIMLITDGMAYGDSSTEDLSEIAAEMYGDDGVITSVFDVGRPGDPLTQNGGLSNTNSTYNAYCRELMDIAEVSGGKYTHNTSSEGTISDDVFAEMTGPVTEAVVERSTSVNVERRYDDTLEGIGTSLPNVGGYYFTETKPSTSTVLTLNHMKSSGATTKIPLYTYWNYGNGRVATFTSAYSGSWLREWSQIEADNKFFCNVYETAVPAEKNSVPYSVSVEREGTVTRVEATPAIGETHFNAKARVEITYPAEEGGEAVTISADMGVGPYGYYYEFETDRLGEYGVHIIYEYMGTSYDAYETVSISYKPEYDSFAGYDVGVLHKAVDEGGTVSLDGKLSLENDENDLSTYTLKLTLPLLIAAVALYVVDIIVRKLKWEDIKSFFGFKKKQKGGSGQ